MQTTAAVTCGMNDEVRNGNCRKKRYLLLKAMLFEAVCSNSEIADSITYRAKGARAAA